MDHNNLDELFKEQLKNLEATPNNSVWNNIESKLKKKRVVPFWWFASGIAAFLVLGMFLFPFSNSKNDFIKSDSEVIITEKSNKKIVLETINKTEVDSIFQNKSIEEKIIVAKKETNIKQTVKPNKSKEKKKLVSKKKAMKKIFLADNSSEKRKNSTKNKTIVFSKNKTTFSDKKSITGQKKIHKVEKKSNTNKVDLNTFTEKKDRIFSTKSLKNKWSIAPVFAVLNSNSFSNTSPIQKSLSNSTKGKNSLSYGFQVGYQINKKWSIQSGIHLQETSFANNQVTVVSTISKDASSVAFNNGGSFSFDSAFKENSDFASNSLLNATSLTGDLNQKYGYIEIPIEIKYNFLSTKKLNTQLVAGFSSLFLNKNEINFNAQFQSKSGKAANLNKINFSGNLGFDFNYSLNKKWSLNLSPMFKLQLNTFSEKSNGFSPFNVGIYSGIKYQF